MAKKVFIEIFDDTDGSQADQTVPFGLDGVSYEIDLSTPNANTLRTALAPYVSAARRTGGRRIRVAVGQSTDCNTEEPQAATEYAATHAIRSWAQDNGYKVADRGRIPASLVEAYHTARETGSPKTSRKTRPQSKSKPGPRRGK